MTGLLEHLTGPRPPTGLLCGVAIGVVTNTQDPDGLGRVRLALPWMADAVETDWARVATLMAGPGRGSYFLPEVNDEVLVAFEHGSPDTPYVIGALWNGQDRPPQNNSDGKNDVRSITSRSGHVIRLVDTDGAEQIDITDSSGTNSVVISTRDNTVTVSAGADVVVRADAGALRLSGRSVEISAETDVRITAGTTLTTESGGQLGIKGKLVTIN